MAAAPPLDLVAPAACPDAAVPVARPAEFDAIYATHVDDVAVALRRLGVREAGLEDAVQDVFLVVHRRLRDYAGPSMRAWLFGIALRVARDHRRRDRRKARGLEPLVDDAHADAAPGPLESAAHAEALAVLGRLLDALDEDKREVLVLAELEQMTVPEMSAALGVNANTLYGRLRAARAAFDDVVARYHRRTGR